MRITLRETGARPTGVTKMVSLLMEVGDADRLLEGTEEEEERPEVGSRTFNAPCEVVILSA